MQPETGQKIKIVFRNGMVESGIVESWSNKQAVIKSISSENRLIIFNVEQDVLAVKIEIEEQPLHSQQQQQKSINSQIYVDEPLEIDEPIRDINLRTKKLTELKLMRIEEEKKRAREMLSTFENKGLAPVEYGIKGKKYDIQTKLQQPTHIHPTQKIRDSNKKYY